MFVENFIRRPVLTIVCSIIILLVGAVSIPTLAVEQYPDVSPVQVVVSANYIGASAEVVEDTVTTVLERQINGIKGMRYISSTSSDDGSSSITVTFEQGYDLDIAAVDVLNRVSIAEAQLPQAVQRTGVNVFKQSSSVVVGMSIFSEEEGVYDDNFVSNYADLYVVDSIKRIDGVSDMQPFGERRYAMRLWLDPSLLASRGVTAQDVVAALQTQNVQIGAGRIGQPPTNDGQRYQLTIRAAGRLQDVTQFEEIVLKTGENGSLVKLKDVGRAELGAENYDTFARYRGQGAIGYRVLQTPGSNALAAAKAVKARMKELAEDFPPGLSYAIPYDPTLFVEESSKEVVSTLIQAILLVVLVLFLFLQNWRATIVPAVVIPVALIGTFAFIKVFDFSINSLTLFGLTLATGMVVDDAIVVVEDIGGKVQEQGMRPHLAAIEAMGELSGAVIATSLVLLAVFIPVAFFPGTTGQLYQQFALTISFAVIISTFNALTLTPALSSLLLRQGQEPTGWLAKIFAVINRGIDLMRSGYRSILEILTNFKLVVLGVFAFLLAITVWMYQTVPTAFLPDEDQGYVINLLQGPEGTSLEYTGEVMEQVDKQYLDIPEVRGTFSLGGFSFSGRAANYGISFVPFEPWGDRKDPEKSAASILNRVRGGLAGISQARVIAFNPPAIQGLGSIGGFVFQLQDKGNNDIQTFIKVKDELIQKANARPELQGVFSTYSASAPQLLMEVNRDRANSLQVPVDQVLSTVGTLIGSNYVNDFNAFGRTYRVYVQADKEFRSNPKNINQFYVRSQQGTMIPLGDLIEIKNLTGPQTVNHYNLFPSIEINGSPAEGYSSGQAIAAMEEIAEEVLPQNMDFEWSGITLEEIQSGGQAPIIFGLGILFVFLVLAAQYENFVDPVIILLAVPLAILGALLAQSVRGLPNDVYCQVGLVMLIGLASKNAILIVEFANQLREQGLSITRAAVQASEQRLRPIVMTAISTLLGIFPLVIATGAGAASRQSLGTAVFGGMIVSTVLSLFVVPVLYIVISTLFSNFKNDCQSLSPEKQQAREEERETVGVGKR
ncbi:hydrophobe/amphiphile efflux-1 (HAE1) family transporter [Rivularia sp. PCC 7116]|uniref:efflux RND transporter permease subunit n=1 Tax=Rivularia sp. PCC 7116 TaxID=373994 RepID=UPI00029EFC21|nr:efflux RND transporter permease subunit [Rivularia sp. PCC 7116]AFY58483.1 hydrophobe/amphiphile efflux-1 (HAE1) family transporter [Rivularia sp. PCC 7116]